MNNFVIRITLQIEILEPMSYNMLRILLMPVQNMAPGLIWTKLMKFSQEFGSYRVNLKSQKCKDQRLF